MHELIGRREYLQRELNRTRVTMSRLKSDLEEVNAQIEQQNGLDSMNNVKATEFLRWAVNQKFFDLDTRLKFAFFLGSIGSPKVRTYKNINKNCMVVCRIYEGVEQAVIIPVLFFTDRANYIETRRVLGR